MLLSELVMTKPPLWTGATAVYPFSSKLEERFRFVSRYGDDVLLHRVDGNLIHLPRELCPVSADDRRSDGIPVAYPSRPKPRPNQVQMFAAVEKLITQKKSGVVSAYTGFGKTALGYLAAAVAGCTACVITTKDDIYRQWVDKACGRVSDDNPNGDNMLGLTFDEVGEIRGDKCEIIGTKFCVAMIQTLSRDGKYDDDALEMLRDHFGLIIFDECHRVPAEQFSRVVDMFSARIRLGLSATPSRLDGKEPLVFAHVGPILAATEAELMVPKVLRLQTNWACPRIMRTDHATGERKAVRFPHEAGKTVGLEKIMAVNDDRNKLLTDSIADAYHKGRIVVVFSTLHDHLDALAKMLHKHHKLGPKEVGFYIGANTKAEREARDKEKAKRIILTTYTMMGEGTSIDWIDTCVLAMPRSNVAQPIGRIRREFPDKKAPVVIDPIDDDSPVFSGYASSRLKWYQSIGAEVKDLF